MHGSIAGRVAPSAAGAGLVVSGQTAAFLLPLAGNQFQN